MEKTPKNLKDVEGILFSEIGKLIEQTSKCEPEQRIENIKLLISVLKNCQTDEIKDEYIWIDTN